MSTEAVIERVVAQLTTLPNIGRVHDRLRLLARESEQLDALTAEIGGDRRLRSWLVHLGRIETRQADSGSRTQWDRTIVVEGFADFEDAAGSETALITLAEQVIARLWFDAQSTKLGGTILWAESPRLVETEPRSFAGIVCSYVRLEMRVHTIEDFTNP